ncbi:MAG: ABC transporter ATP-binding protein [Mobilicoccus sp.]|nr:ABC transporter ATP-binding protein [Mobilicoccus sp.]
MTSTDVDADSRDEVTGDQGGGDSPALLELDGLAVQFPTSDGIVKAVDGVDLTIRPGEVHCIVGESGCGKSQTLRAVLQLLDPPGHIAGGEVRWRREDGEVVDLAALAPKSARMRSLRGGDIGMVFQEPARSLSPMHTVGFQISEAIRLHSGVSKKEAWDRAVEALRDVQIPRPELRAKNYPFELSGGMRQRAMIAVALSGSPRLLLADEPTTALDVTTQAQILELLQRLRDERDMAICFITHDLGVVADIADRVSVMYLGRVVETAEVHDLFDHPAHPYTRALLESVPRLGHRGQRLTTIRGTVPSPFGRPNGCTFNDRCEWAEKGTCDRRVPPMERVDSPSPQPHAAACLRLATVRESSEENR